MRGEGWEVVGWGGGHLLERERCHVERQACVHEQRRAVDLSRKRLKPRQRREEHLSLMRILREPGELGTAVDHPHLSRKKVRLGVRGARCAVRVRARVRDKGEG